VSQELTGKKGIQGQREECRIGSEADPVTQVQLRNLSPGRERQSLLFCPLTWAMRTYCPLVLCTAVLVTGTPETAEAASTLKEFTVQLLG
jgi:hypothetical protein